MQIKNTPVGPHVCEMYFVPFFPCKSKVQGHRKNNSIVIIKKKKGESKEEKKKMCGWWVGENEKEQKRPAFMSEMRRWAK